MSITMKDLWQALRAGGGFISILSTKSPPLRCSTYSSYSVLHSVCSLSPLTLFPDQCSLLPPSRNITLPFTVHSFTPCLVFTHLHLSLLLHSHLFDFVSLVQSTLLPLFFFSSFLSLCFIALTSSLLSFRSFSSSLLPVAAGVFSVYFAYAMLFSPYSLPVYLPVLRNPWRGS